MSKNRLQSVTNDYKAKLLAHDQQAVQALESGYQHTLKMIQPSLDKLYREIAAKQASGETIPLSWLYEQKRLQTIKQLITNQINHYAALSQMTVGQLQHVAVQLGQQSAMAQLQATVPPGIQYSFGVPSSKAINDIVGVTQAGSPLADLFNGFGEEAADDASKALIAGVVNGDNPRTTATQVMQALGISRARALTIARTETLRAYRSANLETFRANSDVVGGWIWSATLSARTCAACLAMNGTKHSLDEGMASHVNCRCVQMPDTKDWSDILGPLGIDTSNIPDNDIAMPSGEDWLNDQDETVQKQVLGAKFDGWSNGDFSLSDIVGYNHDADWGKSIYEKPLKELVK